VGGQPGCAAGGGRQGHAATHTAIAGQLYRHHHDHHHHFIIIIVIIIIIIVVIITTTTTIIITTTTTIIITALTLVPSSAVRWRSRATSGLS
jgi:uncharacterized membrane-anchored protein